MGTNSFFLFFFSCAHWAAGIGRDDWRYSEILDILAKETNNNDWPFEPSITPPLLLPLNEFDVGYHQNIADWEVKQDPSISKPFSYATAAATADISGSNATCPQVQVIKPKPRNSRHRKILGKVCLSLTCIYYTLPHCLDI